MRIIGIFFFLLGAMYASAQHISTVDIVKGKQEYENEVMFFYKENWEAFRKEALKQKVISGYQLLRTKTDSTGYFTLVLITEYKDSIAFSKSEELFRPIMKKISPNGPRMMNDVPRSSILKYIEGYEVKEVFRKVIK